MDENTNKKQFKKTIYLITLLPIVVLLAFNLFQYCENDDSFIYNVVVGRYEINRVNYATFIHPLLGGIWKVLYSTFNSINWIVLTYLIIVIFCTCVLIYLLSKYVKTIYAIVIGLLFEIIFCCWFTFTVLSGFATFFGMTLLIELVTNNSLLKKPIQLASSIVMLELGFLLRSSMFFSVVIIMLLFIYYNVRKTKINKKNTIIVLSITIVFLCSINIVSNSCLNNSKEQKEYLRWSNARSSVMDYPISNYDDNKNFYKSISFSKNDYEGIVAEDRYMADKKVYSCSNLNAIADNTPFNIRYNCDVVDIILKLIKLKEMWVFGAFWILCLIASSKKLYVILQGIITAGSLTAQIIINRYVHRVFVPLLIVSAIILAIFTLDNIIKNYRKIFCIGSLVICGVYCAISLKQLAMHNEHKAQAQEKYNSFCEYIDNHKENLYVTNGNGGILDKESVSIINNQKKILNLMTLFNYDLYNGTYYRKVKKYNLTFKDRLIMDLTDKNVFYVDLSNKGINKIVKYIEEHSHKRVIAKKTKVMEKSKCTIYSIRYSE